jgi:hypothetical protein
MSILGRIAGFAAVGPIGAIGPTEASKRAKKQLAEMKRQTALLERATREVPIPRSPDAPPYWGEVAETRSAFEQRLNAWNERNR